MNLKRYKNFWVIQIHSKLEMEELNDNVINQYNNAISSVLEVGKKKKKELVVTGEKKTFFQSMEYKIIVINLIS